MEGLVSSVFAGTCDEIGYQNGSAALFENPRSLLMDPDLVTCWWQMGNNAIRSITPGEVSTVVGTAEKFAPSTEGPASKRISIFHSVWHTLQKVICLSPVLITVSAVFTMEMLKMWLDFVGTGVTPVRTMVPVSMLVLIHLWISHSTRR